MRDSAPDELTRRRSPSVCLCCHSFFLPLIHLPVLLPDFIARSAAHEAAAERGSAEERSAGRRQTRSLSVWSSAAGRAVRRVGSRLSELTSSALRPLRTALRRWSSPAGGSRSGYRRPAGGAPVDPRPPSRPSRRLYAAGCDCGGGWARQGLLRGRGVGAAGLAGLVLTSSYWIPVLGLVFLLGHNQG